MLVIRYVGTCITSLCFGITGAASTPKMIDPLNDLISRVCFKDTDLVPDVWPVIATAALSTSTSQLSNRIAQSSPSLPSSSSTSLGPGSRTPRTCRPWISGTSSKVDRSASSSDASNCAGHKTRSSPTSSSSPRNCWRGRSCTGRTDLEYHLSRQLDALHENHDAVRFLD
jgi:hypothetical protein